MVRILEWLVEQLSRDQPTLVGINHGFSFPLPYFTEHGIPLDWPAFLDGSLAGYFHPVLSPADRKAARIEGWILGIK